MTTTIRIIIKEVRALMPHGEPLTEFHTVDIENVELADWLGRTDSMVVGAELIVPPKKQT